MAEKSAKIEAPDKWQMTTGQKFQLGFSAFGDLLNIFSSPSASQAMSYEFQEMQSRANAVSIARTAQDIVRVGQEQENRSREEGLRVRGEQRVAMGSSGFSVESKSYKDIIEETDRNIERNARAIRESTLSAYASKMYDSKMQEIQAGLYEKGARLAKKEARGTALGSAISGVAKAAAISYFG